MEFACCIPISLQRSHVTFAFAKTVADLAAEPAVAGCTADNFAFTAAYTNLSQGVSNFSRVVAFAMEAFN